MLTDIVIRSVIAGLLASVACGLGVLPLAFKQIDLAKHRGIGYGIAGGMMFAASVYNLILPGLNHADATLQLVDVLPVLGGILLGAGVMSMADRLLETPKLDGDTTVDIDARRATWLLLIGMTIHSIPEGVAVGVGFTSGEIHQTELGEYIALAIGIHNIPEGLAVGLVLRLAGYRLHSCFWLATLTSLPQPIAAVPAVLVSWLFRPLMPLLLGFAAGAMIFLIILELIPDAMQTESPKKTAWSFTFGFCLMMLIQVIL